MNEYSLSPPFPDPSRNLSTERPQGPIEKDRFKGLSLPAEVYFFMGTC